MKKLIFTLVALFFIPSTSGATAIVISEARFIWSTLNIEASKGLVIKWDIDPFSAQDLVASDTLTENNSLNVNTHSEHYSFSATGSGPMYVQIQCESIAILHIDSPGETCTLVHNHEMQLKSSFDQDFAESGNPVDLLDWGGDYGQPETKLIQYHGSLYCTLWINDGDIGSLDFWLHREIGVNSVVPEPATIILLIVGLSIAALKSTYKHVFQSRSELL
jgi:hypothetical protein